jgi:hypothetical protein
MYFGVVNTGYATSFFIPTILNEMGYTAIASQVRSIPIFCVAAVLVCWLFLLHGFGEERLHC